MIKLNTNDIAISSFDGKLIIYNNQNYELLLSKKIFEENEGINCMIQLRNGDIILGRKKLKIINLNLENKKCEIIDEINLKDGLFDSIIEMGNKFLITYDTNNEIKLWKNYKFIYKFKTNITNLFKINDNSFLTSSIIENKISLYKINFNKTIPELIKFSLNKEMHIKEGKNSLIKINNSCFIIIYEKDIQNNSEDDFEESKNNEAEKEQGICLIEINPKQKYFKILDKIQNLDNKKNYNNLVIYLNDQFMVIEDYSKYVEIWCWDSINKKIFVKYRINLFFEDEIIISAIYIEGINDFIFQTNKKLVCLSNN